MCIDLVYDSIQLQNKISDHNQTYVCTRVSVAENQHMDAEHPLGLFIFT
jgi:hypothetical protein